MNNTEISQQIEKYTPYLETAMNDVKKHASLTVDRNSIEAIKNILIDFAQRVDLFPAELFIGENFGHSENALLFKIYEDNECEFTLYLNSISEPLKSPIHNHGTWAVIAGILGEETNTLYETDDKEEPYSTKSFDVVKGSGAALLAEDLHSIDVEPQPIVMNLHLYGKAMSKGSGRKLFNASTRTWTEYLPQVPIIDLT